MAASAKKSFRSIGRFLKNIIKHPGNWVLASLIAIGIAFAAPVAAPGLIIFAGLAIAIATPLALVVQFYKNVTNPDKKSFQNWAEAHPVQGAAVAITLALLITALVLTIGFFTGGGAFVVAGGVLAATGGGAFAFMGPLFAAIATPFATAAAGWGISLSLSALAGFCLVIASLNVGNMLKRFLAWLDSFKFDAAVAAERRGDNDIEWEVKATAEEKVKDLIDGPSNIILPNPKGNGYPKTVFDGIFATIENGFSSPYEDKLQEAREAKENKKSVGRTLLHFPSP